MEIQCSFINYKNPFVVYELDILSLDLNANFELKDCLFVAVKLMLILKTNPNLDMNWIQVISILLIK